MTASFQHTELGFDHQDKMPEVPSPEEVSSYSDYIIENQLALLSSLYKCQNKKMSRYHQKVEIFLFAQLVRAWHWKYLVSQLV